MATNLRLNYEMATAKAGIVQADADAIQTIVDSLRAEVEDNVTNSSVWSGDAAQKFLSAWNDCADNFNSYVEHIKLIQDKIDYTAKSVSTFDQQ